jgi:hypothetical protein
VAGLPTRGRTPPKPAVVAALAFGPIVFLGVLALVILGAIGRGGNAARAFVTRHFAEVRRDPKPFLKKAANAEMRAAYEAVAASRGEDLPYLTASQGRGSLGLSYTTRRCMNVKLLGTGTDLGLLIIEETSAGKDTIEIDSMSVKRPCSCSGKRRSVCRIQ